MTSHGQGEGVTLRGFSEPNTGHVLVPVRINRTTPGSLARHWSNTVHRWHRGVIS